MKNVPGQRNKSIQKDNGISVSIAQGLIVEFLDWKKEKSFEYCTLLDSQDLGETNRACKGQLISNGLFDVLVCTKKPTKIFKDKGKGRNL